MPQKLLPPTQADVDEATEDAMELVKQVGLPAGEGVAHRMAGSKAMLLSNISLFLLLVLNTDPHLEGWRRL